MKLKFFLSSLTMFVMGGVLTLAHAQDQTIGDLADFIVTSVDNVVSLIVALCYVSGIGFASAGVLKFKQHKENPAQVTLGTCFMLLFIGVALVWLPTMIQSTGATIFGLEGEHGSAGGGDIFGSGANTGG